MWNSLCVGVGREVAVCISHGVCNTGEWELQCVVFVVYGICEEIAVCESRGVWLKWCLGVLVSGICSEWGLRRTTVSVRELRCVGIVVHKHLNVWKQRCTARKVRDVS